MGALNYILLYWILLSGMGLLYMKQKLKKEIGFKEILSCLIVPAIVPYGLAILLVRAIQGKDVLEGLK